MNPLEKRRKYIAAVKQLYELGQDIEREFQRHALETESLKPIKPAEVLEVMCFHALGANHKERLSQLIAQLWEVYFIWTLEDLDKPELP